MTTTQRFALLQKAQKKITDCEKVIQDNQYNEFAKKWATQRINELNNIINRINKYGNSNF